ncbi:cysteine desulfurase family protein [Coraliomargarita sinensis]|nr:cysteine desulfurase family protein [Coraliomargarita sinensis]
MRFFDYNATTPLLPEARAAWLEANDACWLNPSSPYRAGAAAHARLEEARDRLAALLDVDSRRIVFNSGATEGNNAVLAGWSRTFGEKARVGVGATEHPSVLEAAKHHFDQRIDWLEPEPGGVIQPETLEGKAVSAVSIMAANNETGVLNPWQEWAKVCRGRGITMHCDASQWIGKMPLEGLGACDFVTACAHKFGGPKGAGFLLVPEGCVSGFVGGAQEGGRRAGTENLAGILSMLAALEAVEAKRATFSAKAKGDFLDALEEEMPGVTVIGRGQPALWNTVAIVLPDFKSSRWIRALERKGVLVSAGSACSTGKGGPSHVLAAMGLDPNQADRALRISSGWETTPDDWSALLDALLSSYKELKKEAAGSNSQVISI